jgi:hypothetical protein
LRNRHLLPAAGAVFGRAGGNSLSTADPWSLPALMPRRRFFIYDMPVLRAVLLVATVGLSAVGADPVAPTQVRESAPEIFYMQDDAGRLVPVPGFRYRDFVDLLRIKEGLPGLPEPPPAVIENVVLRATVPSVGAADGTAADAKPPTNCAVTVELTVRQSRAGWASLPLALDGLLFTAAPRHEGPGRILLAAAAADGAGTSVQPQLTGYRLWMTGPENGTNEDVRHSVILTGNIAIDASPNHESIMLQLPRATASLVELKTPRIVPEVSVRPPSLSPRVEPQAGGTGSTVTLVGLAGPVKIRLATGGNEAGVETVGTEVSRAAVPQAMVESLVRVDGRVAITEAGIRLDNLPQETATIRVTLPPRATLRSIRSPSALVALEGTDAQAEAVIRVERGSDGRSLVELECERPVDPSGRESFEPLGFAVEGIPAWRQWGRASLVVEGDWQVEWDDVGGNRRIDPPLSARRTGFVAAFAYDAQPARLPLRVLPRGSRVVIEPEYRYDVSTSRVALDARLRVSVRGAPVSRIVVALDGWDVDEVGPASVVDSAAVSSEGGRLVVPFVQPLSGDAVVEIRGGRTLDHASSRVDWRIPAPQADLVGPASIIITSQSDIELLPDAGGIRGLVRQLTPNTMRSDAERVALAYRLDGTEGSFEATRRFLPRRVDASVAAQVDIDESDMIVRQTIRFDVAHVPLEFITLAVPEPVMRTGTLEVRQNGLLLNPDETSDSRTETVRGDDVPVTAGTLPEVAASTVQLRTMLAMPLLGAGDVTVEYQLPTPDVLPESTVAEDLPLVLPAATRIGRQSIALTVPETLSIEVRGDAWKRDVGSLGLIASRTWTTARSQEIVPLAISARKRSAQGDTSVDAAWLQTKLLGDRREDTYRYAIVSSAEQIALSLPAGSRGDAGSGKDGETQARDAAVEVRLNGRPVPGAARADGQIVIELPRRVGNTAWLVELVILGKRDAAPIGLAGAIGMPTAVSLQPPLFPAGTLQNRFYWELLIEPDEHAIGHPSGWSSEQRWAWGSLGLHRVSVVSRDMLATWLSSSCGFAQPDAVPAAVPVAMPADTLSQPPAWRAGEVPGAGGRLVFSGVGPPGVGWMWVVPTWLLVLAASGPVLALGFLVLYLPRLRTMPVVLCLAGVAILAAAAFPELAPLAAQAALPGAVLAALAAVLRFVLDTPAAAAPPPRVPAAVASASSLTQVAPQPSLIINPSLPAFDDGATAVGRNQP